MFSNSLSDKDLHNLCFDKEHRKLFGIDFFNSLINDNNIIFDAFMNYNKDKNNYEYYIKTLLEKGADINHKNNYEVSPKELAENIGNYDV
ncbi:MAG: hypothetical protein LBK13_09800, partial [Spirochaetales bacterium]|nr:hypothetical protein [Spirochaetales bacterium]